MTLAATYLLTCLGFAGLMLDSASLRDRMLFLAACLAWPVTVVAALAVRFTTFSQHRTRISPERTL